MIDKQTINDQPQFNIRVQTIFGDLYPIALDYISNPEKFLRTYVVSINSKKRHIITYRSDDNGKALRSLHFQFNKFFKGLYKSSSCSYAYKKGRNIVSCINQHLLSDSFLKADIHAYFESITYEETLNKLKRIISRKTGKNQETNEVIFTILKACFYENKLPIGFRSSPVISDFYLTSFDKKMKGIKNIVYTRYADDLIISTNGDHSESLLEETRNTLTDLLKKEKLTLNLRKTYIRRLKQEGDAIHILGLNIVKSDGIINKITVSDKYIRKVCRDICTLIEDSPQIDKGELKESFDIVNGEISFIKYCSKDSFIKLEKMFRIKSNQCISLSGKDLAIYLHIL